MNHTYEMTTFDCRDELAMNRGWRKNILGGWDNPLGSHRDQLGHPIPDTIEEAMKIPEGWSYSVMCHPAWANAPGKRWTAAWKKNDMEVVTFGISENSELEARFRLRVEIERLYKESMK